MSNPKISIITAVLNCADTLKGTLDSILSQTYNNYEYIIVDGGSRDGTIDLITEYQKKFGCKLIWTSEPDENLYDALNKGLKMASGDIIGILNADDFYTSNHILERIAEEMGNNPIDAIYGDVHYVDRKDINHIVRYYSSRIFRPWLMRLGFMPAHPSFYCRKEVYQSFGTYDTSFRIAADFELLLRIIYKGRIKTKYIPMDFVTMRRGGISTSGIKSHLQTMKDHIHALKKNHIYSNVFILGLRYLYKVSELIFVKKCQ